MELAFGYALLGAFLVSLVSLIGIATLSIRVDTMQRTMHLFIGLAAGALLGDAFVHLIPEAFGEGIDEAAFSLSILGGILVFFILEKYLRWHDANTANHSRCIPGEECAVEPKNSLGALIIFGDGVHNFVDGAVIAASFSVSLPLGIATTIAVFLHEVPQEVSDFALLIHSGYSRVQALIWNFASALMALLGVIAFFALGEYFEHIEPIAAAFTAGGFIYIAAVNLIPELKETKHPGKSALEILAFIIGIGLMFGLLLIE